MKQINILKTEGFSSYAKYVENRTKEKEECLSKREYYRLKKLENEELNKLPTISNITYKMDLNNIPDDVKNLILYASKLGALVKVKDAGIINEDEFNNIKKRIDKSENIISDMNLN